VIASLLIPAKLLSNAKPGVDVKGAEAKAEND